MAVHRRGLLDYERINYGLFDPEMEMGVYDPDFLQFTDAAAGADSHYDTSVKNPTYNALLRM